MSLQVIRLKLGWQIDAQRGYWNSYWISNVAGTINDFTRYNAFLGKFFGFEGVSFKWFSILSSELYLNSVQVQRVWPDRSHVLDQTLFFRGITGTNLGPSTCYHATCRIHWFTASQRPSPHWTQLPPVPVDEFFLGLPRWVYIAGAVALADLCVTGFTTAVGDAWNIACRYAPDTFHAAIGNRVELFKGTQKTRRVRV